MENISPLPKKRLYRRLDQAKLGGVCAGLAEYFDLDVSMMRIAFVLGALTTGIGLPLYVIMWVVLPVKE